METANLDLLYEQFEIIKKQNKEGTLSNSGFLFELNDLLEIYVKKNKTVKKSKKKTKSGFIRSKQVTYNSDDENVDSFFVKFN
jgi:hypothetical protein